MLHLWIGRSGAGKSEALLRKMTQGGGVREQVLIVPEQHSHTAERALCEVGGDGVSLYAEVLSFTRLASRVFAQGGGLATPTIDEGGRLLLMRAALQSVVEELRVYVRPSRKPAFLTGLIATVDELKSCQITPEKLWQAGLETGDGEGDKLRDLSLIYGAYQAMTAQQGADPRDRLTRLVEKLRETNWAKNKDFYLDGFTDFTPQERAVIGVLLEQVNTVTMALTCDHVEEDEGGTGIFSPARRTAYHLKELAKTARVGHQVTTYDKLEHLRTPTLSHLEGTLFAPQPTPLEGSDGIALFVANSPYSEVEYAASQVLRLVREEGYRFRDITVAVADGACYIPLVETIFGRYDIPVFLSHMTDVLQKPVFALITAALRTVAGGYTYDDIFAYLKTGLTDLPMEEVDLLENYALKWDIKGSKWTQKKDWTMHPRGYGLPMLPADEVLLVRLNEGRTKAMAPLEKLRKHTTHTGRGQGEALYRFLEDIAFPERLEKRAQALESRGALAQAEEDRQLWDILCGGLEQCANILGDIPMEMEEFSPLFALVLSQYDVGTIPVSLDRVNVGEMQRLAHKKCKVLFLVGADDSVIPRTAPSAGLLNDDDRSLLASYGLETAPKLTDKLYREMTIVYETCALPTQQFFVSWAQNSAQGEGHRPSFLLNKLRALFPQMPYQSEGALDGTFRLSAPRPALELCGVFPAVGEALKTLPQYVPLVERLEGCPDLVRGHLCDGTVATLYGKKIPMSASRMDKHQSCHFSYFMQYGLKATPRTSAGFQAPEYGTFVHYVLEHTLRQTTTPDKALVQEIVNRYIAEELGGLEQETPRFQYLFKRLIKSVWAVVDNVAQELAVSDFKPISFELGFGRGKELPPVEFSAHGVTISVSGFVDRVDGWERDGRLYLRIVDYKTGRKSFDLSDVWYGMGMQMLLYLFTLEENGTCLYGKDIVPAGVLYLPARDGVVAGSRSMTEKERIKEVDKALRRRGLLLDDIAVIEAMETFGEDGVRFLPLRVNKGGAVSGDALVTAERLGKLHRHTDRILQEIGTELVAGNIKADPFWKNGQENACQWCDFKAACHFEEGRGGDIKRYLPSVKGKDFWTALDEKEKDNADEGGTT